MHIVRQDSTWNLISCQEVRKKLAEEDQGGTFVFGHAVLDPKLFVFLFLPALGQRFLLCLSSNGLCVCLCLCIMLRASWLQMNSQMVKFKKLLKCDG